MLAIRTGCIVMDFDALDVWTPEDVAEALRAAIGRAHTSATITYRDDGGQRRLLHWNAGGSTFRHR